MKSHADKIAPIRCTVVLAVTICMHLSQSSDVMSLAAWKSDLRGVNDVKATVEQHQLNSIGHEETSLGRYNRQLAQSTKITTSPDTRERVICDDLADLP